MDTPADLFAPTQAAALKRLDGFVPRAGVAYAQGRNHDRGTLRDNAVSALSPYIRTRALDEISVARAVLSQNTPAAAEPFLRELFWRTYWKGWMELRPTVWDTYQSDLNRLWDEIQTQSGLRQRWESACLGQTGIAAFDGWAQELGHTGYLHNHARMWFASIWIFTLKLPWQLGADFFLRHLLDGDAAVNTLSWRWVAGIQTRGKNYLAHADNIAKFTGGRFKTTPGLVTDAAPVQAAEPPAPGTLPALEALTPQPRMGLLLHEDDVAPDHIYARDPGFVAQGWLQPEGGQTPMEMAPMVEKFRSALARDCAKGPLDPVAPDALAGWAREQKLDLIVAPYAPVGPTQSVLAGYTGPVPLFQIRRPLDTAAWPLATRGFFPFRKHIPELLDRFVTS